ncbi:MAG: hypothetical protein JRN45_11110 [Nitrososphaerota archaeon]|nr:hypothetical protein [Nitrososphaerota archaeon]
MITRGHQRKGIASLPVSIFFVALVASALVGVGALTSGQSGFANKQISVGSMLAARQQELSGLSAFPSTDGTIQLTQNSGAQTSVVYALLEEANGQTLSARVNYGVSPGQATTINITSLAESITRGSLPSLTSVTLATSRGLYITSQVQTVQQTRQVTTYQQEQVQETGQRLSGYDVSEMTTALVGYDVSETTRVLTGYDVTQTSISSVLIGYDVTAHYPVTTQVLSGYDLYMTVAHTTYTCPSGWTNYQDSLCSYTTTETVLVGEQYWAHYCYFPLFFVCGNALLSQVTFPKIIMYTYMVPIYRTETVTTYASATLNTYYTTQYEGFSSSCPSYAYQLGITCYPVYTTQTTYQTESLGLLSYCPMPNSYTRTYYSCSSVYHQQTTTTNLGQMSYCPSGSSTTQYSCSPVYQSLTTTLGQLSYCPSGSQYSCTPVYQSRTTSLGELSYCPSGSQYSCSAIYSTYTYWITETVPVVTTVSYETLSTSGSTWLIGG